jgi:hypothetical protein
LDIKLNDPMKNFPRLIGPCALPLVGPDNEISRMHNGLIRDMQPNEEHDENYRPDGDSRATQPRGSPYRRGKWPHPASK